MVGTGRFGLPIEKIRCHAIITAVTGFKTSSGSAYEVQAKVRFTIADNKIYKGDFLDDKDRVLTHTGKFTAGCLLFMSVKLTK